MSAVGLLGTSFIVLFILGYVSFFMAALGILLLAACAYSTYKFYQDVSNIAFALHWQNSLIVLEEQSNEED
jgi:hypothetical protein